MRELYCYAMLFVDDDPVMLNIFKRTFGQMEMFRLHTASNTVEAMDLYSPDIDLILLDIHLGENYSSGVRIASMLREKGFKGIICMFTGDASPALLFQSVLAGANDYILKGPTCNLVGEIMRLIEFGKDDSDGQEEILRNPIEESAYLRSAGLSGKETLLLKEFAENGYPRIKEFAVKLSISETCLWKRLARIRDKLRMDSTSQIAHLLTSLSMMDVANSKQRTANRFDWIR